MKPLNRRLHIEEIKTEPKQGMFFVPTEEKVQEFMTAVVLSCASDCAEDLSGKTVVFHTFGKEEVRVNSETYIFIGESHLICVAD